MKTTWAITNAHDTKWANAKRREFDEKFPLVRWTFYHSHGKLVFHPTWRNCEPSVDVSPSNPERHTVIAQWNDDERHILQMTAETESCFHGVTFAQIYEQLGGNKPHRLYQLLCVCLHLAREHSTEATSIIGRTGDAMGLRRIS